VKATTAGAPVDAAELGANDPDKTPALDGGAGVLYT
jgi:hypothetical protein